MTHADATRGNTAGLPASECLGELVRHDSYDDTRMTLDGRVERRVTMMHCLACESMLFFEGTSLIDAREPVVSKTVRDLARALARSKGVDGYKGPGA
jgi:hypothetical protein